MTAITDVSSIPGLNGDEARVVASHQNDRFIAQLAALSEDEWARDTDCTGWSVKDIAAHVLGSAEGWLSFEELRHQQLASMKRRKEFGGMVDALNGQQVEDRAHLSPREMLDRLSEVLPRFVQRRATLGRRLHYLPFYDGGYIGWGNGGFLMNSIYSRDVLMHRIDVARATGGTISLEPLDGRLVEDVVRGWVKQRSVDARVVLSDVGEFLAGDPARATIAGDAVTFCRILAKRGAPADMELSGDSVAAAAWLAAGCPF